MSYSIIYDLHRKCVYGAYGLIIDECENVDEFFERYPYGQVYDKEKFTYYKMEEYGFRLKSNRKKLKLSFEYV